jgi:hypothetical protein
VAIFAGFHFFHASAQTVATEKLETQNLINGRLVVTRGRFGMSTNEKILLTSNPDGTGVWGVSISSSVLFPDQSAWSPDGTKIAFVGFEPTTGDIYVTNGDGTGTSTNLTNTPAITEGGPTGGGGDFDGDNKADVAVYRPGAQSVFYYRASIGNPQRNISVIGWGVSGDKPVVGDYDGDGRSDATVYRPSNGTWYVNKSSDGQLHAVNFGIASDTIVPADYDADGKTDFGVFRNGIWYLLQSSRGFSAFQFGLTNDTPVPADYDGDGRADAAIFRDGVWWMLKSGSGAEAVQFGFGTDVPIQSAFVR